MMDCAAFRMGFRILAGVQNHVLVPLVCSIHDLTGSLAFIAVVRTAGAASSVWVTISRKASERSRA